MKRWCRADSYSEYQGNFDIDTRRYHISVEKGLFTLLLVPSAWKSRKSGKKTKYH